MKKLFVLFAWAAVCLSVTACNDEKKEDDDTQKIELSDTDVTISRGESSLVGISGGSGEYTATVDDPNVAEVEIKMTNLGYGLTVRGKKEGETVITVKDDQGMSAACSLIVKYSDVFLMQSQFHVALFNTAYSLPVAGGSGEFAAAISDPELAKVSIAFENSEYLLRIETMEKEGEAVVTVTDTKNGKEAKLALTVKKIGLKIEELRYAVEAEQTGEIEADLPKNTPYPVGSLFYFNESKKNDFVVKNPVGEVVETGTFTLEVIPFHSDFSSHGIRIEDQIYVKIRFTILINGNETVYHTFVTRGNYYYFCEDLTAEYKAKFPDAGVEKVGRGFVCKLGTIE